MDIYEGNFKVQDFLVISLTDIPYGLVGQCDDDSNESQKDLIGKYEVSYDKQDILNEVTNMCNNCRIKDTSQDPDIWFNELYNLNLKFKKIKSKYEKYEE